VITRAELLHAHQPLAVGAESEPGGITCQISTFAAIEESAASLLVEGPELVEDVIADVSRILLHAQSTVG
jgi:hypothetical protein